MEILDLDRLHNTIKSISDDKWLGRGEGRTTALLALLMGEIELGDRDNTYLFICPNARNTGYTLRRFVDMLESNGFTDYVYKPMHNHVIIPQLNILIFFDSISTLSRDSFRGHRIQRVFLDVNILDQHCIGDFDEWQRTIDYLKSSGADFV
jgi:hypothetical protein